MFELSNTKELTKNIVKRIVKSFPNNSEGKEFVSLPYQITTELAPIIIAVAKPKISPNSF